jgi:hypothetical protein
MIVGAYACRFVPSLPLQGLLAASGQPLARREQSTGLFLSGLGPEGRSPAWGGPGAERV